MKSIAAFALLIVSGVLPLAAAAVEKPVVVLKHGDLEKMQDFAASGELETKVWAQFEQEVTEGLSGLFAKQCPGGTLEITFTEIDRAGDVNTYRNRGDTRIRYMEAIYPPRATFDYVVKNEAGAVVVSGTAKVNDLDYLHNINPLRNSTTFFYEVEMLRNWVRGDLAKELAAKPAK